MRSILICSCRLRKEEFRWRHEPIVEDDDVEEPLFHHRNSEPDLGEIGDFIATLSCASPTVFWSARHWSFPLLCTRGPELIVVAGSDLHIHAALNAKWWSFETRSWNGARDWPPEDWWSRWKQETIWFTLTSIRWSSTSMTWFRLNSKLLMLSQISEVLLFCLAAPGPK